MARASWEELRKEARSLENQIDAQLVALGKLGTSLRSAGGRSEDRTPLLGSTDDDDGHLATLTNNLDNLLSRLASVNVDMNEWAGGETAGAAIHHTVQRHRDILQDYRQEFAKTKSNLSALMDRYELMGSKRANNDAPSSSSSLKMDLLLKESEHARNSERLIDDQISIALESRDALVNQRLAFKAVRTKLNDITNRFPVINNLVQRINVRKRRDAVIIAVVVGLCMTFSLWWIFS